MNLIKKNWQKVAFLVYSFSMPIFFIYADSKDKDCTGKICNPLSSGINSLPDLITSVLQQAIKIGIPIIALAVIYSGFLFVFARGNSEKITKAKDTLLYTLIGAAILLGSLAIATMISSTVNALK